MPARRRDYGSSYDYASPYDCTSYDYASSCDYAYYVDRRHTAHGHARQLPSLPFEPEPPHPSQTERSFHQA